MGAIVCVVSIIHSAGIGVGNNGPCEVMLDEPAHVVSCRGRLREARTARGVLVAAMGLVERFGEEFDGCPDGGAHPTFWDLVVGVTWTQPQVVAGVRAQRSMVAPGGCHKAEAGSRDEPTIRSKMLQRTRTCYLSGVGRG